MVRKRKPKQPKQRDKNIELSIRREISLRPRIIRNKKAYSRKQKHRSKYVAELSTDS